MIERPSSILAETKDEIAEILGPELGTLTVERVVIGVFFTGVRLSNGFGGLCATPVKSLPEAVCCPSSVHAMPLPGRMRGRKARELLDEIERESGLRRAVGVAVLNALAAACRDRCSSAEHTLLTDTDAFDAARIRPSDHVVLVGAFGPFIRALRQREQSFVVLEKDPSTLRQDEMRWYRPAEAAAEVVPRADVLLVTGTTLVNDTLEDLLDLARRDAEVVMIGPTVSLLPEALFRRGVRVAGGVRVTDPDALLDLLAEGGSGHHFFGRSAQKVVLVRGCCSAATGRCPRG